MGTPIDLSFRGDGQVMLLRRETVRAAFFRLVEVNGLKRGELRPFEAPGLQSATQPTPLLACVRVPACVCVRHPARGGMRGFPPREPVAASDLRP